MLQKIHSDNSMDCIDKCAGLLPWYICIFMTNSTQVFQSFIQEAGGDGGGDFPGCYISGIHL